MAFSGKKAIWTTCYGLYSNAHRGKMRKAGVETYQLPIIQEEQHLHSKDWAELIRKVLRLILSSVLHAVAG